MVILDIDMPKNCVECHEKGIQEMLECRLIFSGCANCGRHPKCPIKCDIEDIKAEVNELSELDHKNGIWGEYGSYEDCKFDVLQIINRYIGKEQDE